MRVLVLAVLAVLSRAGRARGEALGALEALLPSFLLDNVDDLLRVASAACELVPLEAVEARLGAEAPPDVVEYRRGTSRVLPLAAAARRLRAQPGSLPVYVPGWHNGPADGAARALVAGLLRHHRAVLVLDTRRAFGRTYLAAAARVPAVARALLALVRALAAAGLPPARVHVVGFSLGAHAAGAAGRLVRAELGAALGRITALDPARPCFTRAARRLRSSDAAHVQAIHSSAGVLGLEAPVGHADVYVRRRPECAARGGAGAECDHNAAWRVFAASARDTRALVARRCSSWRDLQRAECAGPRELLGYPCPAAARGMYLHAPDDDAPDPPDT